MSQYPPLPPFQGTPPAYSMPMQPPRTSGMAITSLVLGILGCVPWITGVLAVVFGIFGIRVTSDPAVRGRGMAIAGLVLGLLSIMGWTSFGGLVYVGVRATGPARIESRLFLKELSSGDVNAAMKRCAPGVSRALVQQSSDEMQAWGPYQDATFASYNINRANTQPQSTVAGTVRFRNARKSASFSLTTLADGTLKIQEWHIQ
jgi:hypothetical protein